MDTLDDLKEEIQVNLWRWDVNVKVLFQKPKRSWGGHNKGQVKYLPDQTIKRASLRVLADKPERTLAQHQAIAKDLQVPIDDGSSPIDIEDVSQRSLEIVLKLIDYVNENRSSELIPMDRMNSYLGDNGRPGNPHLIKYFSTKPEHNPYKCKEELQLYSAINPYTKKESGRL